MISRSTPQQWYEETKKRAIQEEADAAKKDWTRFYYHLGRMEVRLLLAVLDAVELTRVHRTRRKRAK